MSGVEFSGDDRGQIDGTTEVPPADGADDDNEVIIRRQRKRTAKAAAAGELRSTLSAIMTKLTSMDSRLDKIEARQLADSSDDEYVGNILGMELGKEKALLSADKADDMQISAADLAALRRDLQPFRPVFPRHRARRQLTTQRIRLFAPFRGGCGPNSPVRSRRSGSRRRTRPSGQRAITLSRSFGVLGGRWRSASRSRVRGRHGASSSRSAGQLPLRDGSDGPQMGRVALQLVDRQPADVDDAPLARLAAKMRKMAASKAMLQVHKDTIAARAKAMVSSATAIASLHPVAVRPVCIALLPCCAWVCSVWVLACA
jgi:hypothetical protein